MSLSLYASVLRLARVGFLAWAVVFILFALLIMYVYPSVRDSVALETYLTSLPEEMLIAIGAGDASTLDFVFSDGSFDFRAWLSIEFLGSWPVMVGIYAVVYASGLVSREVERGTLDLLLSQPLDRSKFLLSKFTAFATLVLGIGAISYLSILAAASFLDVTMSAWYLLEVHIMGVLLVLTIAAYSTLASCLFLDPRKSLAVAGIVTVVFYFLNILAPTLDSVSWLQKVSLFYHYNSLATLFTGKLSWAGIGVYLGVLLGALGISLAVFQRRDILK